MKNFDILVVGGGHAGIEAASAGARMGCSVGLITMDKYALGRMSCNPAIGGTAKGHLVREIDALGGIMGQIADRTGIQFRMLNRSKGPAVWSSRCQSDRELYSKEAYRVIASTGNIEIVEASATEILAENGKVIGIRTASGDEIFCKSLILSSWSSIDLYLVTALSNSFLICSFHELPFFLSDHSLYLSFPKENGPGV